MPIDHYGVVIDAGSSGSRLQVYKWQEVSPEDNASPNLLHSVPHIIQDKSWGTKTSPGISTFADKPGKVWNKHLKALVKFAEEVIPKSKQRETPIFLQATAGMRMLPVDKRQRLMNKVISELRRHTSFTVGPDTVQVIDGETEGLYGWLALNYLEGRLNNYDPKKSLDQHDKTFGFMDMGGASTQIAFVPSQKKEREKYKDVLYNVRLRSVDGTPQDWPVFVSTWLGFGANQARRRHLRNLIMALPDGVNYDTNGDDTYDISDPCSPHGLKVRQEYKGITYDITGSGNYKQCLRTIYPLLLKHLPCKDEDDDSCLFNGVSAPQIDFDNDQFVGISEYWYTANDVFRMAGEYNFKQFENRLKSFCEADWSTVERNYNDGKYGQFIDLPLLKDSCFKASWVVNVLHEGFGLPRVGLETDADSSEASIDQPMFQSANTVNGAELSWPLGKILLYASSKVPGDDALSPVGIFPSPAKAVELQRQAAVDQRLLAQNAASVTYAGISPYYSLFLVVLTFLGVYFLVLRRRAKSSAVISKLGLRLQRLAMKVTSRLSDAYCGLGGGNESEAASIRTQTAEIADLEEGRFAYNLSGLRTRSTANLQDLRDEVTGSQPPSPQPQRWMGPQIPPSPDSRPALPHSNSFSNFRNAMPQLDLMSKRFPAGWAPGSNSDKGDKA